MFDPRVGGVKGHAIQKLKTFSESQHQTTMKNAWEHEKTQFLFKILVLVPPMSHVEFPASLLLIIVLTLSFLPHYQIYLI